jgi:hypothetical protein
MGIIADELPPSRHTSGIRVWIRHTRWARSVATVCAPRSVRRNDTEQRLSQPNVPADVAAGLCHYPGAGSEQGTEWGHGLCIERQVGPSNQKSRAPVVLLPPC